MPGIYSHYAMNAILSTHGLTRRFGDVVAVDNLSIQVCPAEIYGFLGLNGAGKTTTIRMLLGMIRPTAGEARLFGQPVAAAAHALWAAWVTWWKGRLPIPS